MAVSTGAGNKVSSKRNMIIETKGFSDDRRSSETGAGTVKCPSKPSF